MYALVRLHAEGEPPPGADVDHESFVDRMIGANVVLLGSEFLCAGNEAPAAGYVLRVSTLDGARDWVARDPLVASGLCRAEILEWDLVGVNTGAIEEGVGLAPGDAAS